MTLDASYRRILNRMGYYAYQQGLIYRRINQDEGWNSHLANCRNFIIKALDCYMPSVVTVLGSGWLLDLPLMEMTDRVEKINLVDIVHPPEVRDQVASFGKVILVENDITGGLITEVWQKTRNHFFFNRLKSLDDIMVPEYKPAFDPGMIISLNILTQLESLPMEFLKKKTTAREEDFLAFRRKVQEQHILLLRKSRSVLITDISEVITGSSGKSEEKLSVVAELPEAEIREEWTWNFDHRMSDYYTKRSVFRVAALVF